jgi:hypothetical protein
VSAVSVANSQYISVPEDRRFRHWVVLPLPGYGHCPS